MATGDFPNPGTKRSLDVNDALDYLHCVKVTLNDAPNVYRRFIQILKEFKSGSVGTDAVMKHVSILFNGYPSLIQGFNIFLPAGYRLDCTVDGLMITSTTPSGVTTQTANPASAARSTSQPDTFLIEKVDLPFSAVSSDLREALEFIQWIKARRGDEPEGLRRFLDAITNAKEGNRMLASLTALTSSTGETTEVLVERLAKFLRESPESAKDFLEFWSKTRTREGISGEWEVPAISLLECGKEERKFINPVTASTIPQKRKRKVTEVESRKKQHMQGAHGQKFSSNPDVNAMPRGSTADHLCGSSRSGARLSQFFNMPREPPSSPHPLGITIENWVENERSFFERVKHSLDDQKTYHEFLKLVNLFSQNIINAPWLLRESRSFLGKGELLEELRVILGLSGQEDGAILTDRVWLKPRAALDRPSLNQLNVRHGSYRKLPANEVHVVCSGRDDLCNTVLNDEWVSQPTTAGEDTVFQTHKKNAYEEALHRSEEERHEYDFYTHAILCTIQMLEVLNTKMTGLHGDSRDSFKLQPNLDGAGKGIHVRILKKLYGSQTGLAVFQELHDRPMEAVPAVLTRLKLKLEEWRKAQAAWDLVWREIDSRNYQKSLDHQALTFRVADKKAMLARTFVSQIEAARDEQKAKRTTFINPLFARKGPRHQMEFIIGDLSTIRDVLRLVHSYLDRSQGQTFSGNDKKKIKIILQDFIPLLLVDETWALDPLKFKFVESTIENGQNANQPTDGPQHTDVSVGAGSCWGSAKRDELDLSENLRKKTLKNEQAKLDRQVRAKGPSSLAYRHAGSMDSDPMQTDHVVEQSAQEILGSNPSSATHLYGEKHPVRARYTFFANATFYVVFRLLEVLHSRLSLFKQVSVALASNCIAAGQPKSTHDADRSLGDNTAGDIDVDLNGPYNALLESCEQLFAGLLDQSAFEDRLREVFGLKEAYKMFTVDKVIGAFVKQVHNASCDLKSQELLDLLRRERAIAAPTTQDQINARHNAEKVVGPDENLFRIDWIPQCRKTTIQLLGKDNSSHADSEVLAGRWQAYVASFMADEHTNGVPTNFPVRRPFLRRTKLSGTPATPYPLRVAAGGSLMIKVCVRTYRLFFVPDTEEYLVRLKDPKDAMAFESKIQAKNVYRQSWLRRLLDDGCVPVPLTKNPTKMGSRVSKKAGPVTEAGHDLYAKANSLLQSFSSEAEHEAPNQEVASSEPILATGSNSGNSESVGPPVHAESIGDTERADTEVKKSRRARKRAAQKLAIRQGIELPSAPNLPSSKLKCPFKQNLHCQKRIFPYKSSILDHVHSTHGFVLDDIMDRPTNKRIRKEKTPLKEFWETLLPRINLPSTPEFIATLGGPEGAATSEKVSPGPGAPTDTQMEDLEEGEIPEPHKSQI